MKIMNKNEQNNDKIVLTDVPASCILRLTNGVNILFLREVLHYYCEKLMPGLF